MGPGDILLTAVMTGGFAAFISTSTRSWWCSSSWDIVASTGTWRCARSMAIVWRHISVAVCVRLIGGRCVLPVSTYSRWWHLALLLSSGSFPVSSTLFVIAGAFLLIVMAICGAHSMAIGMWFVAGISGFIEARSCSRHDVLVCRLLLWVCSVAFPVAGAKVTRIVRLSATSCSRLAHLRIIG